MAQDDFDHTSPLNGLAIQAGDAPNVKSLIGEMVSHSDSAEDERHRLSLLRLARALVQALETPRETVLRLCWAEVRCASLNETQRLTNVLADTLRCDYHRYRLRYLFDDGKEPR
jgi:hypothetical protein